MDSKKKPLHSYDQSMLLSAMLFDRKNIAELLQFFPKEQSERMHAAIDHFSHLSREERITKIVLELRRLLLIDEHKVDWIHKTWIEDALRSEPLYLQSILKESIDARLHKTNGMSSSKRIIPLSLVFRMFIEQLTKIPPKTAIYDPALMRLQTLRGDCQHDLFCAIGLVSLQALAQVCHKDRLCAYLKKKGSALDLRLFSLKIENHPFSYDLLKKYFLQELIRFTPSTMINSAIFAGLLTTALYLARHKLQWQRWIVLGLHQNFGRQIEKLIFNARHIKIDHHYHGLLSNLVMTAFDQVRL